MPNIRDHAVLIGEETLEERPFDPIDGLLLTQIVYMPMEGFLDRGQRATLKELWGFLEKQYPQGFEDPFQQKRYLLTEACASMPRYRDWEAHHYYSKIDPEREMQFGVCSFDMPHGQTYIAYRGTDWSLTGWKEDLNMCFMTVPSQREAVEYAQRIAAENGNALLLGGHSKGGNLAVYAGARVDGATRERIRRVHCFDGPGVDEETLHSEEYALLSQRIESYLPQSSIVGMLLHHHPVYTVVHSKSVGILQHDAMNWQVKDGAFVTLKDLDLSGRVTDETVHTWLKGMDIEARRLLVDTLYQVLEASQRETLDGLVKDWQESALKMLEALRELAPEVRKNVRHLLMSLFSISAKETLRNLLPHVLRREPAAPEELEA